MLDNSKISKGPRAGFTLIEVMVAMVIVTMMIVMIGNIFQQVSDSWNIGTQSSNANTAGRAAMDLIVRELSHAVAGPIETSGGNTLDKLPFKIDNDNDLRFVALSGEPSTDGPRRALRGISFYFENDVLKYARNTTSFDYNSPDPNHSGVNPLIPNVTDFKVYAYATEIGSTTDVFTDQLPYCVDIFLELLSSDDMLRYKHLGEDAAYKKANARRFSTRVYFPNRKGYAAH